MSSKQIYQSFNNMLPARSLQTFSGLYLFYSFFSKEINQNKLGIHNVCGTLAYVQEVNVCMWVGEMPGTLQGQRSTVAYL